MKALAIAVLALSISAAAVDQKSLLLGVAIGGGLALTKNQVAIPVSKATARVTKKAAVKTKRAAVHAITFGKK